MFKNHKKECRCCICKAKRGESSNRSGCTLSEETKKKISTSLSKRYTNKENHPRNGKTHSEVSKRKMSTSASGRTMSEETKRKISLKMKGRSNSWLKGKKLSRSHIKKVLESRAKNKKFKDTTIELKVEEALKLLNVEYSKQEYILSSVDFYIPEYRTIVEADGCFWHGCPIHNPHDNSRKKSRDAIANKRHLEAGYTVIRLWQHDIEEKSIEELSIDIYRQML